MDLSFFPQFRVFKGGIRQEKRRGGLDFFPGVGGGGGCVCVWGLERRKDGLRYLLISGFFY